MAGFCSCSANLVFGGLVGFACGVFVTTVFELLLVGWLFVVGDWIRVGCFRIVAEWFGLNFGFYIS